MHVLIHPTTTTTGFERHLTLVVQVSFFVPFLLYYNFTYRYHSRSLNASRVGDWCHGAVSGRSIISSFHVLLRLLGPELTRAPQVSFSFARLCEQIRRRISLIST